MNKKKANQKADQQKSPPQNTSITAQNTRLAARVESGPIDTFAIMRELNICRPGARICDLRNAGYNITTTRIVLTDEWGRTHRGVALYTLIAKPKAQVAA